MTRVLGLLPWALLLSGCDGSECSDQDVDGACDVEDCAPSDPAVYPGADDPFGDGIDGDCDGIDGVDADADGFPREDDAYEGLFDDWDCDDLDAAVFPGQDDDVGNGIDDDCDGIDGVDSDADGYASVHSGGDDCDDWDGETNPGAEEVCDGLDNDCDGAIDNGDKDTDGDGFADCIDPTPEGYDGPEDREEPLSVQLHLHGSLSEFSGTMAYHTAEANEYGVDVLWWSDHDAMMQMLARPGGHDFDNGQLGDTMQALGSAVEYGFVLVDDDLTSSASSLVTGGPSGVGQFWHLEAESDDSEAWQVMRYSNEGDFFAHHVPLMTQATVSVAIRPRQPASGDWQLQVVFSLSGSLDDLTNTMTFYLGGDELNEDTSPHTLYQPMFAPADEWTTVAFPITDAAIPHFVEQEDQGAHGIFVQLLSRNGAHAEVDLDDWHAEWTVVGEPLREAQELMLANRYSYGTTTHFVGQEMTPIQDRKHVNVLGVGIPMHDYGPTDTITIDQAVAYVHQQGGVALCNHPFGTASADLYEGEAADAAVLEIADVWIEADGHACDAVEVGYQARGVDLEHHLMFWDELGKAGVFVTGVGSSDNHWTGDWMDGELNSGRNRYLSWVFQDVATPEGIMQQVESGRLFFGDPLPFLGEQPLLDLWTEHGAVMGQALASELDQRIHVETGYLETGWSLALIGDGEVLDELTLEGTESETLFEVARGELRVIRAEVRDTDGGRILISNPLFLEMP